MTSDSNWTVLLETAIIVSEEATCIMKQFIETFQDNYFQ